MRVRSDGRSCIKLTHDDIVCTELYDEQFNELDRVDSDVFTSLRNVLAENSNNAVQ